MVTRSDLEQVLDKATEYSRLSLNMTADLGAGGLSKNQQDAHTERPAGFYKVSDVIFRSVSIQDVKTGTESTDLAVSAMEIIHDCIQSIKALMDEIAAASVQQSDMIVLVENGIKEISTVVQSNSAAAEKSAAVSKELSNQARTLNRCG